MNPMSAQDAMFLHVENDVTPMHIGGVSIFEGPAPAFTELSAMVGSKLHHTPRYRQKVRFVPFGISEPVWVDDRYFDLSYHLRHTAVPAPGSESQLRGMAARVFSQHLDRARPLWEIWMVEGLSEGRWALLSKVHHCMVDGVAATDLMSVMFDDDAVTPPADGDHWAPAPEPSGLELLVRGVAGRMVDPASQVRRAVAAWPQVLGGAVNTGRALAAAAPAMRPATSSLTGPIGPHRTWSWATVELGDVKQMRQALGGTVNDIVLTVITNGFRALLDERGEAMHPGGWSAPWSRCPCAVPTSEGSTTTACRRCSHGCPSGWTTPRRVWPASGRRWTGSRPASRRWPATSWPSSPGLPHRCYWRSAAGP